MTDPRRIAGWVAVISGVLLLIGIAASALGFAGLARSSATGYWPMGPGMMGRGPMGPGMMGFGMSGPAATAIPGATAVRVQAANFSFSPSEIRVHAGADLNLTLDNPAATGVIHDLTVPALGIHLVANAGESRTLGLRGLAAGRYDAYCSVPGHAELGMRAILIVE